MLGLSSTLFLTRIYCNFSTQNSTPNGVPQWGDLRFNLTLKKWNPQEKILQIPHKKQQQISYTVYSFRLGYLNLHNIKT